MRAAAVVTLTGSQLMLVAIVNVLLKKTAINPVALVAQAAQDPTVTVICWRDGLGIVIGCG